MTPLVFDTETIPVAERANRFASLTPGFEVTPLGDPFAFASRCTVQVMGATLFIVQRTDPVRFLRDHNRILADSHDHYALTFLDAGIADIETGGRRSRCTEGGALLIDMRRPARVTYATPVHATTLLLPRHLIEDAAPGIDAHGTIAANAALTIARSYLEGLLRISHRLKEMQRALAALALCRLAVAALARTELADQRDAQRKMTLLGRMIEHIDANLAAPLSAASLARTLNVSRAALYRGAYEAGGVAELVLRQRLVAVHRSLSDPLERRPITALAQACGFPSPAQFSRQFRRAFGVTAGQVRARAGGALSAGREDSWDLTVSFRDMIERMAAAQDRSRVA